MRFTKLYLLAAAVFPVLLTSTGTIPRLTAAGENVLPSAYGEILYSTNEQSPRHLYIVGISHSDTLTGAKSPYTPRVEAEIYRIGAWLARNKGVEIILPEGFFAVKPKISPRPEKRSKMGLEVCPTEEDMRLLEQVLSVNSRSINAEMLLSENFHLELRQIEDRELYRTVNQGIRKLAECTNLQQHFLLRSELDYHQNRRVGAMLQKVPRVVDNVYESGHVEKERALFTIGLSHIPSILRFVREKKLAISCPPFTPDRSKYEPCSDELELTKEEFGITVIIPRALANDSRLMKRHRIKAS
ncbi:MAG: hypothetical protein C4576_13235 [Desulfobacteraceae bacterium]|nr:MAG: hypothetical protein C4576_13235 [Desulfobacteraceae bacterium]